jgi:hypothetical protein
MNGKNKIFSEYFVSTSVFFITEDVPIYFLFLDLLNFDHSWQVEANMLALTTLFSSESIISQHKTESALPQAGKPS